jgi:hypothetical protein
VFPLSQQSCGACACCGLGSKPAMARTHTTANHQPQHFADSRRTPRKVSARARRPRLVFRVRISCPPASTCVCAESDSWPCAPSRKKKLYYMYGVRRFCLQAAFAVCGAATSSLFSCVAAFIAHNSSGGIGITRENRAAAARRPGGVSPALRRTQSVRFVLQKFLTRLITLGSAACGMRD